MLFARRRQKLFQLKRKEHHIPKLATNFRRKMPNFVAQN
jgi:hypothetical protein